MAAPTDRRSKPQVVEHDMASCYLEALDFAQAEAEFQALLEVAEDDRSRAYLLRRIGDCRERSSNYAGALEVLERARQLARASGELAELGRIEHLSAKVQFLSGNLEVAGRSAQRASELLYKDPNVEVRGAVENLLGGIAYRQGDLERARRHFDEALLLGRDAPNLTLLSRAYNNLGLIYKAVCDFDLAIDAFRTSLAMDSQAANYESRVTAWINLGIVHAKRSEWDDARQNLTRALKLCREVANPLGETRALLGLATVELDSGHIDTSRSHLVEAQRLATERDFGREQALVHSTHAWIALEDGDLDACHQHLQAALQTAREIARAGDLACHLLRLEATWLLCQDEVERTYRQATECTELARQCGDKFEQAAVARTLGTALAALGRADDAANVFATGARELRRMGATRDLGQTLLAWCEAERFGVSEPTVRAACQDRLADVRRLLEPLGDHRALARSYLASARLHLAASNDEAALAAVRQARTAERSAGACAVSTELQQLQRQLEQKLVAHATGDKNRARGLLTFCGLSEGRAFDAAALLDGLAELVGADGALLVELDGAGGRCLASGGLRVQERRALVALLGSGKTSLTADTLAFSSDPRGADEPLVRAASEIRASSSVLVSALVGTGSQWLLYLDRGADSAVFDKDDLDLLAALNSKLPAMLQHLTLPAPAVEGLEHIDPEEFICEDDALREILQSIVQIRGSSIRVLLQGETGTGKGRLARLIHDNSIRRERQFRLISCANLSDTLLESELFGHVKGAFTGATSNKIGLLEEASGGTVFLDDIEKSGHSVQRRLLHFLDCGEIRPVGSTQPRALDVRIICATSIPSLIDNVRCGQFLKDLYYRLHHFTITMPPLRERRQSIPALTRTFVRRFAAELGIEPPVVSEDCLTALANHNWPGNVRELENTVRRAVVVSRPEPVMGVEHLATPNATLAQEATEATGRDERESLQAQVAQFEAVRVAEALELHEGNKSKAAEFLGLTRKGLRNKMKRYGIDG